MFIRIVTIKCPNERAKKAFKLLNKEVTAEDVAESFSEISTIDKKASLEGRKMFLILSPR